MKHTNSVPHEVVQMFLSESMGTRTMMEAIPLPPSSERSPAPTQRLPVRRQKPQTSLARRTLKPFDTAKAWAAGAGKRGMQTVHDFWRRGAPRVAGALVAGTALVGAGHLANKASQAHINRSWQDTPPTVQRSLVPHTPEATPEAAPEVTAPKVQPIQSVTPRKLTRFKAPSIPHHVAAGAYRR